jgi:ABC-type sugar transport system ATPase subunit
MISGVYQPTSGEIYFQGRRAQFSNPAIAREMGIETIYQDLALAGNLDVSSNIFLGREIQRSYLGGIIRMLDNRSMFQSAQEVLASLDIRIPSLNAKIDNLSGGQRQAVAIARALFWNARVMIMDEPTNNLGVVEQGKVLDLIRKLKEKHIPVILISHTMHDVFAVTDRIVVLHRGRKVAEKRTADTTSEEIVQYMIGVKEDAPQAATVV